MNLKNKKRRTTSLMNRRNHTNS